MYPNLDLDVMRTFLAIVDHGGFTRAASRLNRTQSTVSLHVRRLEEAVGKTLFERQGRTMRLTDEGEILRAYARNVIDLTDELMVRVRRPPVVGIVRVGVPEDFATRYLPRVLRRFAKAHAQVRLEVRSAVSADLLRDLANGDLDLVLARRTAGEGEGTPIWRERLLWVDSDHERHREDPLPLVMFPHGCIYRPKVLELLRESGRSWQIVYTSTSLAGVQAAVAAGLGVTVLAESTVTPDLRIVSETPGLPPLPDTEFALFGSGERESEAVALMRTHLEEVFSHEPALLA